MTGAATDGAVLGVFPPKPNAIQRLFGTAKVVIGVIHLPPLPGSPHYTGAPLTEIETFAAEEARAYLDGGCHGLIVENHWDIPFPKPGEHGYETAAAMAVVTRAVRELHGGGLGVSVLSNAAECSIAAAWSAGADFVRVNQWANAYVANEGIIEGQAAHATRYRHRIGAGPVKVFADVHVKHGATFLGFSVLAWIALATVLIGAVLLYKMPFGNHVNGVGAQEESVRRAGVNTRRIKMIVLALSGLAAGAAGILTAARLGSGSSNSGQGFELTVIAAVVLGGTNLFGGRGTVVGTIIGAVITGVIANGLTLLGVSPFLAPIVTGLVLVAAIWINLRGRSMADLAGHLVGKREEQ